MIPFLQKVAEYIVQQQGPYLKNTCLIAPNKRAGVFLTQYFKDLLVAEDQLPSFLAVEDFFLSLSEKKKAEEHYLPFDLYEIHKEIEDQPNSFDDFASFANMLLADFSEIDQHLVSAKELFHYINELKAVELWKPDKHELTEVQKRYLAFFRRLYIYYEKLNERLDAKNLAYQGKAVRHVAENIEKITDALPYEKLYFIGFNALTPAEEKALTYLKNRKKAEILWDADDYYFKKDQQEAGFFLRKWKEKFGEPFLWSENFLCSSAKQINICGVPKNIGQVKATAKLLNELQTSGSGLKNKAVVLANESLIVPMLNHLPQGIDAPNVTMGVSLSYTSLYDLLDQYILIQKKAFKRKKKDENTRKLFAVNELIEWMKHPFIQWLNPELPTAEIERYFLKSNRNDVDEVALAELKKEQKCEAVTALFGTFSVPNTPNDLLPRLQELLAFFATKVNNITDNEREKNAIKAFIDLVENMQVNLSEKKIQFEKVESFHRFFREAASGVSVAMLGDPLNGLQIMGMLETRTLDFEEVILLSANEGILPAGKSSSSLIPFEVKIAFRLPTYREKDAIFAYHFYRLLQRAKKIDIFYNTEPDPMGGGDKSRFIQQLINELPKENPNISIHESFQASKPILALSEDGISVEKNEKILAQVEKLLKEKEFSASVINRYLGCKLKFYFSEILGYKESEEVAASIDASMLGSVVHEVLNDLYSTQENQWLSDEWIDSISKEKIAAMTEASFEKLFPSIELTSGKNLLIRNVANSFVYNFLQREKKELGKHRIKIIGTEKKYNQIDLEITPSIKVMLKGFVDRIDLFDDKLRIIDYKTGQLNASTELKIAELSSLQSNPKLAKAFQLLMYIYLYHRSHPTNTYEYEAAIISFKQMAKYAQALQILDFESLPQLMEDFEEVLRGIFLEMLDVNVPFSQTEEVDSCRYCEFAGVCMR